MTDPADLAQFLLARYAEEEAAIRERATDDPFLPFGQHWSEVSFPTASAQYGLASIDVKRRLVKLAQDTYDPEAAYGWDEGYASGQYEMAQDVLSLLALPYAAHPDYRQEWKL